MTEFNTSAVDYKEQSISGKSWIRAKNISIANPYNASPVITIQEERAIMVDSTVITAPVSGLLLDVISDVTLEIPILDLNTLEDTGTTTSVAEIYKLLHAYYHYSAKKRDDANAALAQNTSNSVVSETNEPTVSVNSTYDVQV
jgi:hypothetical protein